MPLNNRLDGDGDDDPVDLQALAQGLGGYSGADIEGLCRYVVRGLRLIGELTHSRRPRSAVQRPLLFSHPPPHRSLIQLSQSRPT